MHALIDLLPQLLGALAVAAHIYMTLQHGIQKEPLPMSEAPDAPVATSGADNTDAGSAPAAPAPAPPAAPAQAAPAVNSAAVVGSVVQTVSTHPDVPQNKAVGIIASILGGLYQAEPAIFAVTRSSPQTQAEVGLGIGLAEVILGAFLHPAA